MKKLMHHFRGTVLLVMFATELLLAQNITTPRAGSPAASVSQRIGISDIKVDYSRPKVNGREIWGALVPYGWNVQQFGSPHPAPWRAGANENTVIEFSHPAQVEGVTVPAGSYGLFFVINADNSGEVILSKDYRAWGNFFYDPKQDLMRRKIDVRSVPDTELLTYDFINVTRNSTELVLNWEKKQFPVKIEFAVDDIVVANAEAELKGAIGFTAQGFLSAANYSLQNGAHMDKGLAWIERSIQMNKTFGALNTKSGILRKMGKTEESDKILSEAVAVATEPELNNYGYQLMGQGENDKAIEMLALNVKRFPKSANAWDSLGEAYAIKGDKQNAIKNFKKALTLNPPDNVKVNSEKYLKQFGAL